MQMWQGRASVPVQMWQGRAPVLVLMWQVVSLGLVRMWQAVRSAARPSRAVPLALRHAGLMYHSPPAAHTPTRGHTGTHRAPRRWVCMSMRRGTSLPLSARGRSSCAFTLVRSPSHPTRYPTRHGHPQRLGPAPAPMQGFGTAVPTCRPVSARSHRVSAAPVPKHAAMPTRISRGVASAIRTPVAAADTMVDYGMLVAGRTLVVQGRGEKTAVHLHLPRESP